MYKLVLALITIISTTTANSQYLNYAYNGELVREIQNANYKGSSFLFAEWIPATVKIGNVDVRSDLFNVDLYADKTFFKRNDSVFAFKDMINEFTVIKDGEPIVFKRGNLINAQLDPGFIEVISTSPLVVKQIKINVSEQSSYGSATKEYAFAKVNGFFIQEGNGVKKIKFSKDEAQKVFNDKWSTLVEYASSNKISFKTEEGWRALTKYYGTLK